MKLQNILLLNRETFWIFSKNAETLEISRSPAKNISELPAFLEQWPKNNTLGIIYNHHTEIGEIPLQGADNWDHLTEYDARVLKKITNQTAFFTIAASKKFYPHYLGALTFTTLEDRILVYGIEQEAIICDWLSKSWIEKSHYHPSNVQEMVYIPRGLREKKLPPQKVTLVDIFDYSLNAPVFMNPLFKEMPEDFCLITLHEGTPPYYNQSFYKKGVLRIKEIRRVGTEDNTQLFFKDKAFLDLQEEMIGKYFRTMVSEPPLKVLILSNEKTVSEQKDLIKNFKLQIGSIEYSFSNYSEASKALQISLSSDDKNGVFADAIFGACALETDVENGMRQMFPSFSKTRDQSLQNIQDRAKGGDVDAQIVLAEMYEEGDEVEKSEPHSLRLYQSAAGAGGNVEAQYRLGNYYHLGKGTDKDPLHALIWWRRAAEQGHAGAQCNVGLCYEYGWGEDKDLSLAVQWYQKAADLGLARAQYMLGNCYLRGKGFEKDLPAAFQQYKKAAENGSAPAMYSLGNCYFRGDGVEKNETSAVLWLSKAAERGDTDAQKTIVDYYKDGKPIPENVRGIVEKFIKKQEESDAQDFDKCIEAFKEMKKKADNGDPNACYEVAGAYLIGIKRYGVEKDKPLALQYYLRAADGGDIRAMKSLYMAYDAYNPDAPDRLAPADHEKSMDYLRKCVNRGDHYAFATLGRKMLSQESLPAQREGYELFYKYYQIALADNGHIDKENSTWFSDLLSYPLCLATGRGCIQNKAAAIEALEALVKRGYRAAIDALQFGRVEGALYKDFFGTNVNALLSDLRGSLSQESLDKIKCFFVPKKEEGPKPIPSTAEINAPLGDGNTHLIEAIIEDDWKRVESLIAAGADINKPNMGFGGFTPLYHASLVGNTLAINALLEAGVDINSRSGTKAETALFAAVNAGNAHPVTVLLLNDADFSITDINGKTALELAEEKHLSDIAEVIKKWIEFKS